MLRRQWRAAAVRDEAAAMARTGAADGVPMVGGGKGTEWTVATLLVDGGRWQWRDDGDGVHGGAAAGGDGR